MTTVVPAVYLNCTDTGGDTMNGWSDKIKDLTRRNAGSGAALKSWDGGFGIFGASLDGKVYIYAVDEEKSMELCFPVASDEVIATFANVEEMIAAGWVID